MSLYKDFKGKKIKELQKELWLTNINAVPRLDKIVVTMWIWSLATRKSVKDFSDLISNIEKITWQKAQMIYSRKSVSNFKLREWMPVMLRVTLRREKAYDFIERFRNLVLPRVRDFEGLSKRKFDGNWNYNIWFPNQTVFAELNPEEIITSSGVQITIVTTSSDDKKAQKLLESLGLIFK